MSDFNLCGNIHTYFMSSSQSALSLERGWDENLVIKFEFEANCIRKITNYYKHKVIELKHKWNVTWEHLKASFYIKKCFALIFIVIICLLEEDTARKTWNGHTYRKYGEEKVIKCYRKGEKNRDNETRQWKMI